MKLIDADAMVTAMLYDEEHEEYYTERMTVEEYLDRYTDEGCPRKGADLQRAYDEGYRKGKEDEHRWWSKLCANCDGAIDEPQPSKILEAYAKGYKDGADAVKGIKDEPQTCDTCRFEVYCPEMCEGCCEWDSHYEPKDEPQTERSK